MQQDTWQEGNGPRSLEEILEAERWLFDKVWMDRQMAWLDRVRAGERGASAEQLKAALDAVQRVLERRPDEEWGPYSDFEWGMLNGKLSALRWVLGDDWDMLDT